MQQLITGTKAHKLPELIGTIPDTQLVIVPNPLTGKLFRSTFGQMKTDIVLAFGEITFLDPIIEVAQVANLPQPGAIKTLYVITGAGADENKQFRWGGSMYIEFPRGGSGDVSGEAIIRAAADAQLQQNINNLEADREAAELLLQTNINQETSLRTQADNLLTQKIFQEAQTRAQNDNTLGAAINSEGTIRASADLDLHQRIDDIEITGGGAAIDDITPALTKVYSSDKTQTLSDTKVDKVTGEGLSPQKYTLGEKTKLAGLESSKWRGTYVTLAALNAANVGGEGCYADVDAGIGAEIQRYIWDNDDSAWTLQTGTSGAETAASIKSKYESNPDTNAFTDTNKANLNTVIAWGNHASAGYLTAASPLPWGNLTGVPAGITLQGNTFNGISQLVQLTAAGKYPALDGSLITNLPGGTSLPPQTGNTGKFLTTDGSIASWGGTPLWTALSGNIYYNTGNVGIGTSSPDSPLTINKSLGGAAFKGIKVFNAGGGYNTASSIHLAYGSGSTGATLKAIYKPNGHCFNVDIGSTNVLSINPSSINTSLPITITNSGGEDTGINMNVGTGRWRLWAVSTGMIMGTNSSVYFWRGAYTPPGSNTAGEANRFKSMNDNPYDIVLVVQSADVQVVNITEWRNSSGVSLSEIRADGGLNIGIGANESSSLFTVKSTTKGLLLPRMTTTQMNAIASPAEGLEIYNTTLKKKCFYNGSAWEQITSTVI